MYSLVQIYDDLIERIYTFLTLIGLRIKSSNITRIQQEQISSSMVVVVVAELNDDVIGHIFTFLSLIDIYHMGLCNTYLSQFLNNDSPIWQPLLCRYSMEHSQLLKQFNNSYKECFKHETQLMFDTIPFIDDVTFSNNNRTVSCNPDSRWKTITATKQIHDGVLYAWKVVLDSCDNLFKVKLCIGLHNSTRNDPSNLLGYSCNCKSNLHFGDRTVIQCVVDTRPPNSIRSAKFLVYKLSSHSVKIVVATQMYSITNIDLETKGPFYPAVTLYQDRQVTLKPCHAIVW
jgi:hypothetical protein